MPIGSRWERQKGRSMATAGVSTLGVLFGYAVETTAGTKPTSFTQLQRCNDIAGISLETEQIDASTLEDEITRYIAGRQDTGGTWSVTFNLTDETLAELEAMIAASEAGREENKQTWFVVWSPYLTDSFYVIAEPPKHIPMPGIAQNGLQTVELTFTINEYKGMDTAIKPTPAAPTPGN